MAIIASLAGETTEQCLVYANFLATEFAKVDGDVQILLADNTAGGTFSRVWESMREIWSGVKQLHAQYSHIAKPGKIRGLNSGLERLQAPYAMFVDFNKNPQPGSLLGLLQSIRSKNVDLVGAHVVPGSGVRSNFQSYNLGAAYVASRSILYYFPPTLNEDNLLFRTNKLMAGTSLVEYDCIVVDSKYDLPIPQLARRRARHAAGDIQNDKTSVRIGDQPAVNLTNYNAFPPNNADAHKLFGCITQYKRAKAAGIDNAGGHILRQVLKLAIAEPLTRLYLARYLARLQEDQNLCSWTE